MSSLAHPHRNSEPKLIQLLRERIPDDTYTRPGFTLALTPGVSARSACVEITNGFLRINLTNSPAPDTNINLSDRRTSNLGGLVQELQGVSQYCVTPDAEMHHDHPSIDLRVIEGDFLLGGVSVNHRRFSNEELKRVLNLASQRQNINYTVQTVPETEFVFVCTLAAADICRIMAQDAVRRRGLGLETTALLDMARSYEEQWDRDMKHQKRAINVAKIKDSDVRRGDAVVGTIYRPSFRTGYQTPSGINEEPETPFMHEPVADDVQDIQVRLTWDAVKDSDFYGMELWRDTVSNVRRAQLGNATIADTQTQFNQPLPTTASLVFSSIGNSTRYGRSILTQYGEASGQSVNTFVDGFDNKSDFQFVVADQDAPPPEPETTYYYRLYVFDVNRLASASNVVSAKTKPLRPILSRDSSILKIDPTRAPMAGGTPITIKGERFNSRMRARLGDKQITDLVFVDTETATGTVPMVANADILSVNLDLSITSDGLTDLAKDVFQYTET